ncbi:MAG: hypothetical protein MUC56_04435 [Thermoanaerobaculales bacterium]|jgi:hypothetical protein|nr:hypothetical protein [Thermoanaerobaculales bacterium]
MATGLPVAPRRLTAAVALSLLLATGQAAAAPATRTTVFSDIVVNEPVTGDVLAIEADVHLGPMADVDGDVVVVGGDLKLDDRARVGRHVLAIFGRVDAAPGASVEGRTLSFSSLSSVVLHPSDGSSLQVDLAVRLLTSGGWLLITTALAFGLSTRLRYGVWMLPQLGLRVLALGVAAAVTFFAAIVAVLGLGPRVGVPAAAALTVVFFALRAVGLTVIGGWLAGRLLARLGRRPLPLTVEVFAGVLVLLVVRFVPVIGGALWSVGAIAALGTGIIVLAATLSEGDPVVEPG